MKLLVVILNYKVTDLTIGCLGSLAPAVACTPGVRVAVCENGTGGDAEPRLRNAIAENGWQDWIDLTVVTPNRGFTGGNNIVIRQALASDDPPDYFLLLNADTLVDPGALQALIGFMDDHHEAGVAGSRLDFPDGSPNGSPFRFPGIASEFDRGLRLGIISRLLAPWLVNFTAPTRTCKVDWVSGASMVIRREVIQAIGPLDEGLYTYYDDVDYCLNATKAGWGVWYVRDSRVIHLEGSSTGVSRKNLKRRPDYLFQARRRFFLKNHGAIYTALADAAFLIGFSMWRIRRFVQRKPDPDPPKLLLDAFRHSVFVTGFAVRAVPNPAMPKA